MPRKLNLRFDKALVRDYISDPNQTLQSLAIKHGYNNCQSASRHITKYLRLSTKERIEALKNYV
jgi:hypothetical protein